MARRRMIEVSIAYDERLNAVSEWAQLLFLRILPHTDDAGRFSGNPEIVKARTFPLSKKPIKKFTEAITELLEIDLLKAYQSGNHTVLQFNPGSFNRINAVLIKNSTIKSEYPDPIGDSFLSASDFVSTCQPRGRHVLPRAIVSSKYKAVSSEEKVVSSKVNLTAAFFEELWFRYPRRDGRKEAEKHYNASVESEQDRKDISAALDNYVKKLKKDHTEPRYIKKGSTWFNNWRDWIPGQATMNKRDEVRYTCSECGQPHAFDETCPKLAKEAESVDPSDIKKLMRNMQA